MQRFTQCLALVLFAACSVAHATPITYGLEFQVQYIGCNGCLSPPVDPRVHIGSTYFGSLVIDDSILASDAINKPGNVSAVQIQFEDAVWNSSLHSPLTLFAGFRGPGGLGASSPGFDVVGGRIVNLRGGVFGSGDFPFVDFSTDVRIAGNPSACGPGSTYCGNASNAFWSRNPLGDFGGSMSIYAIPEPAAAVLLVCGALGWFIARRRRFASGPAA